MEYSVSIVLLLISFVIVIIAQLNISGSFSKYKRIKSERGSSGRDVARTILDANGLQNIPIQEVNGELTDHYNPSQKTINLSKEVYNGTSIASIAVAAHECGHAIQDKENYSFFRIRSFLVPVVNFISYLGYFGLIVSIFAGITGWLELSAFVLAATVVFQLVTLPVEFDASNRAKKQLNELNLIYEDENKGINKMLGAAAMTYVAGLISTILDLLRILLILNSRRRD